MYNYFGQYISFCWQCDLDFWQADLSSNRYKNDKDILNNLNLKI